MTNNLDPEGSSLIRIHSVASMIKFSLRCTRIMAAAVYNRMQFVNFQNKIKLAGYGKCSKSLNTKK